MNAADTIAAAINVLTELKESSTSPDGWVMVGDSIHGTERDYQPLIDAGDYAASSERFENPIDAALIVTLHRAIDPMLAVLRHEADRLASWFRTPAAIQQFTVRTDMDGTWYEIPERAAFEMGLPLHRGGIRHPHPVYLEAELNAAGVRTREPVPAEAEIVDLARAILGEVA